MTNTNAVPNSSVCPFPLRASGHSSVSQELLPAFQGPLSVLLIAAVSVSDPHPQPPRRWQEFQTLWAPFSSCLSESWQVGVASAIRLPYASCYLEENSSLVPPTTRADISRQTLESALWGIGR